MLIADFLRSIVPVVHRWENPAGGFILFDYLDEEICSADWDEFDAGVLARDGFNLEGLKFFEDGTNQCWPLSFMSKAIKETFPIGEIFSMGGVEYETEMTYLGYSIMSEQVIGCNAQTQIMWMSRYTQRCGYNVDGYKFFMFVRTNSIIQEVLGDGNWNYNDQNYAPELELPDGNYEPPDFQVDLDTMSRERKNHRNLEEGIYDMFNGEFGQALKNFVDSATGTEFDEMSTAEKIALTNHEMQTHGMTKVVETLASINKNIMQVTDPGVSGVMDKFVQIEEAIMLLSEGIDAITGLAESLEYLEEIKDCLKVTYGEEEKTLPEVIIMILNALSIW